MHQIYRKIVEEFLESRVVGVGADSESVSILK